MNRRLFIITSGILVAAGGIRKPLVLNQSAGSFLTPLHVLTPNAAAPTVRPKTAAIHYVQQESLRENSAVL